MENKSGLPSEVSIWSKILYVSSFCTIVTFLLQKYYRSITWNFLGRTQKVPQIRFPFVYLKSLQQIELLFALPQTF